MPAGTHELVVTYIGLDATRSPVTAVAGQRVVRDFDLTTGIYKLDAFKVTGEREGGAAATTVNPPPTTSANAAIVPVTVPVFAMVLLVSCLAEIFSLMLTVTMSPTMRAR